MRRRVARCPACGGLDPLSDGVRCEEQSAGVYRYECRDCGYVGPAAGTAQLARLAWGDEATWCQWYESPPLLRVFWPEPGGEP
jgi:hypothetical protein